MVVATDRPEMLPLVRHNALLNHLGSGRLLSPDTVATHSGGEQGFLLGMQLPWGCPDSLQEVRSELQKAQSGGASDDGLDDVSLTYPDLIVGSDIVYG